MDSKILNGGTSMMMEVILKMVGKRLMIHGIYLIMKDGCFMIGKRVVITGIT